MNPFISQSTDGNIIKESFFFFLWLKVWTQLICVKIFLDTLDCETQINKHHIVF
jgi:hypothetical protein